MIRLTETALAAIRADSEQGVAPGMGDVQLMLAELNQLKAENKRLTDVTALQMVRKFVGGMNQSVMDDLVATGIRAQDEELERVKAENKRLSALLECSQGDMRQADKIIEGLRVALTSSSEFLMHDAKVRRMLDGAGRISPMFPLRRLVMEQIAAAMGRGEQS